MLATSLSAPPVIAFGALLCKETWPTLWLMTAQSVSRLHPHHRQARTSLVAGRASLRLTTAAVCGAIDCALRLQTIFDGYVSALSRHRYYVTVSGALTPLSTRNLRLYFRLVNGSAPRSILLSPLGHTDGHVLPPTEVMPPTSQAPGTATLVLRLRRYARLRPRCAARRCTDSTPATMATASLTPSSLRHTARRGRLTLKPQADFRDSLSLRLSTFGRFAPQRNYATPLCAVCSKFASLLRPRSPPLRATSSSPHIATSSPST